MEDVVPAFAPNVTDDVKQRYEQVVARPI